jgi:hypothetical protein
MTGQPWLAATFAVIMIGTAAYCLTRLAASWRQRRPTDRQVDGMHVLMGVAMASMLVPRLWLLWAGGWEILFAASALLFAYRLASRRQSHDAQHLLGCAAMLYMLVLIAPTAARTASSGSAAPGMAAPVAPDSALSLAFAVALLACVIWTADRISFMAPVAVLAARQSGVAAAAGPVALSPRLSAGSVPLSPRLSACCEIVTGLTMGYMLITMLT